MSNVRKALEAAAEAVCEERNHPDYPCGRGDIDANMARIAILTFLKKVPNIELTMEPTREMHFMTPSRLAAAIEKETKG